MHRDHDRAQVKKRGILCRLIESAEDELTCDFAQYYGVFDIRSLPFGLAATLAAGLQPESRSMMRLRGDRLPLTELTLASIHDRLGSLMWMLSDRSGGRPESLLNILLTPPEEKSQVAVFSSPEDFEAARHRLLGK